MMREAKTLSELKVKNLLLNPLAKEKTRGFSHFIKESFCPIFKPKSLSR